MFDPEKCRPGDHDSGMIQRDHSKRILSRMAAFLLIFAVVCLWTFVKHSSYLPKSNVTRHVHAAMKLEVGKSKIEAVRAPLLPTARLVVTRPRFSITQLGDPQIPSREHADLTLALQHRPPPPSRRS